MIAKLPHSFYISLGNFAKEMLLFTLSSCTYGKIWYNKCIGCDECHNIWKIGTNTVYETSYGLGGRIKVATFTVAELKSMIVVNMGDYKIAKGEEKLMTKDLGSCVGVAVRDPKTGVGGLLHVMLPHRSAVKMETSFSATKYADIGLDEMVKALVKQGAGREHLVAKIAGAAHMIRNATIPESEDISSRNLTAVKEKLADLEIPLLASDVGEHFPRTVVFEPGNGTFRILTPGKAEKRI